MRGKRAKLVRQRSADLIRESLGLGRQQGRRELELDLVGRLR
jgi:hypothetical protein